MAKKKAVKKQRRSKKIDTIVVHCSDSEWGSEEVIKKWHLERNFRNTGYHYVIMNGYPTADHYKKRIHMDVLDGSIEIGRQLNSDDYMDLAEKGAHVKGYNETSIGVCLIGKDKFTDRQMEQAEELVAELMAMHNIGIEGIKGHYELDSKKTCPNFDLNQFRKSVLVEFNREDMLGRMATENAKVLRKKVEEQKAELKKQIEENNKPWWKKLISFARTFKVPSVR